MIAAAEGMVLSEGAREALEDIAKALDFARRASARKLPNPSEEKVDTRAADRNLDAAWSSTYGFLNAWAKLPNEPKAATAARLRARLFPKGLKFTQIGFKEQWAESNLRLALIDAEGLDATFDALGGGPFLDALRLTHEAYGEALGITKAREVAEDEPGLRAMTAEITGALRDYVLQVTAMVRKSDPNSREIAQKLLAPIDNWRKRSVRRAAATSGGGDENVEKGEEQEPGGADCESSAE